MSAQLLSSLVRDAYKVLPERFPKSLQLNSIRRKHGFGLQPNLISWVHCALMVTLRPQLPSLSITSNLKRSNVVLFGLTLRTHTAVRPPHSVLHVHILSVLQRPLAHTSSI